MLDSVQTAAGQPTTATNVTGPLTTDAAQIQSTYRLRWRVEEFYKPVKSDTGYSASPTNRVRTQSNHLFSSTVTFVKLEAIKLLTRLNHFALKPD